MSIALTEERRVTISGMGEKWKAQGDMADET